MRVHKLVIDSWPTPDGKPFAMQDEEMWQEAVDHWAGNAGTTWPVWLPEGLDLEGRVPDGVDHPVAFPGGHWVGGSDLILVVPNAPTRVHFFSKPAAQKRLATLAEWGVVGHIESSEPVTWPTPDPKEHQ